MNEKINAPLYRALIRHIEKNSISYHVPGHKNGEVFPTEAKSIYENLLKLDVTELNGLDDLHDPQDVIKEAQHLLASYYGTKKSYFLVNGSTVGNLAMLFATVKAEEKVLIQRNCHKSIINALSIIGATPIFITPHINDETMTPTGLEYEIVDEALQTYPDAKALVITNPSYYGFAQDLTAIIELVHTYGIPVLVDEAHGAHFSLGKPFPKSSLESNADIVVQSAHKTLPAMTMGSFLHINNTSFIDIEKVDYYLQAFQSSSPSYPIMASLDLARNYIQSLTSKEVNTIISSHKKLKQKLGSLEDIKIITMANCGDFALDPLKLIIQSTNNVSGFILQEQFEKNGVYTELADPKNILLILPLAEITNEEEIFMKIKDALKGVKVLSREVSLNTTSYKMQRIGKLALSYKEMAEKNKTQVRIEQSVSKIAAELIVPYPPGIPVIMPGEVITDEKIKEIMFWKSEGARFQGKSVLDTINIFED